MYSTCKEKMLLSVYNDCKMMMQTYQWLQYVVEQIRATRWQEGQRAGGRAQDGVGARRCAPR